MSFPATREPLGLSTFSERLERSARAYGSHIALRKREDSGWCQYSYAQLFQAAKKTAYYLRKTGNRKGDLIGLIGENSPGWVIAFMAIQWIGAVAVPLDCRSKEAELLPILQHSGVRTLFASKNHLDRVEGMKRNGGLSKEISLISEKGPAEVPHLPGILRNEPEDGEKEKRALDDLAILQYTSGTTGNPKGVMLTERNIASNINSLYQTVLFGKEDRFFSVLPIHHVYEGTAGNWLPLSVGAGITYARSLKSKEMIEDARSTEPTVMLAVPLLLEKMIQGIRKRLMEGSLFERGMIFCAKGSSLMLNRLKRMTGSRFFFRRLREQMGFGKLRFFVSGGAALPPSVQRGLEDFGFNVLQGYGLSEASPVLTLNPPQDPRPGSIGLPIPEVEIRITDPDANGVGEIAAKGGNIMAGYYKNDPATREVITSDGFLLTGDMGYQDRDGFIYITGRKRSIIVTRGGENIFPEEIEALMLQSPFIKEILVLRGQNDRTGQEEVQAMIYPDFEALSCFLRKEGGREEIRKILEKEVEDRGRRLSAYKRIRHFTIREEEFPKSSTQKIKRYLFEKQELIKKPHGT